jgi:hypothetical protein
MLYPFKERPVCPEKLAQLREAILNESWKEETIPNLAEFFTKNIQGRWGWSAKEFCFLMAGDALEKANFSHVVNGNRQAGNTIGFRALQAMQHLTREDLLITLLQTDLSIYPFKQPKQPVA